MNHQELKKKLIARDGLKCSVTGEHVNNPNELVIEHIIPHSEGGNSKLDNLILVKK